MRNKTKRFPESWFIATLQYFASFIWMLDRCALKLGAFGFGYSDKKCKFTHSAQNLYISVTGPVSIVFLRFYDFLNTKLSQLEVVGCFLLFGRLIPWMTANLLK